MIDEQEPDLSHEQKRFSLPQALMGLLTSVGAVWLFAMILEIAPTAFWGAALLILSLSIAGAIFLSIKRLVTPTPREARGEPDLKAKK
jgi:hypothetical protein